MKINWARISPKEQAHGLCRYCDKEAVAMNKRRDGQFVPVCQDHEHKS